MSSRRITVVASELLGRAGTGGAGTADSLLAVALGRSGHRVQLLIATGRDIGDLTAEWTQIYESAGVEVRVLDQLPGVRPPFLRPAYEVYRALRDEPPDVVVVNDWRGLGCVALQARDSGIAFADTAFVVHCHGPARVLAEFAQKVPDTLARFGEEVAERASIELADAVVSPSAWLLEWMRGHRWPVPDSAAVIPYLQQSTVVGNVAAPPARSRSIRRLAFFGQLREGKGIRIYLDALNAIEPSLLGGVELAFFGAESKRWTASAIAASLAPAVTGRASSIRIETHLDRTQALSELRRPGTLAVMPSLLDNAPNTVSECIEYGIPFLSTRTGGIPELVAEADRARVLCEPTAADLVSALARALESEDGVAPARAAQDPSESLQAWLYLVDSVAPSERRAQPGERPHVDIVVPDDESEVHAGRIARSSTGADVHVIRAESRRAALERASSEWLLFLDSEDLPDDDLLDRLVAARNASGADVTTCAVRPTDADATVQLFLGDPGSLGLIENQYGVLGLVRRSLIDPQWRHDPALDPDWILFSRLALAGGRITSVPEPLATQRGRPGAASDVPGDGLTVLEAFEDESDGLHDLPALAATLAAAHARAQAEPPQVPPGDRLAYRGLRVLREEGTRGVVRRILSRFSWEM